EQHALAEIVRRPEGHVVTGPLRDLVGLRPALVRDHLLEADDVGIEPLDTLAQERQPLLIRSLPVPNVQRQYPQSIHPRSATPTGCACRGEPARIANKNERPA